MGLQQEIGYVVKRANTVQRALQRFAAIPALSPTLSRMVTPVDRVVHRASGGRSSAMGVLVAFPAILLATVGARTGETRTTPLAAIPSGDDLAVIASNAGSGKLPGWAHNLRANPAATMTYEDQVVAVVAGEAEGSEYDSVFAAATRIYPGYAGYRERADYEIPVFVLTSRPD